MIYKVMYTRLAQSRIEYALKTQTAVVLLGPRQVGKTTLALEIVRGRDAVHLDLESPQDRQILSEPELYLREQAGRLVVIDEVQLMPGLFTNLRSQIDARRRAGHRVGQFLVLGSASNTLLQQTAESLAGRVSYLELTGLNLTEVGQGGLNQLWLRGGFPDAYQATDNDISLHWRQDFIRTYLERDIPQLGPRIPAETLRRFWTMLAHNQGGLLNAARLAAGLGVSGQSVGRYLDLMVDLMLVGRLEPWHANVGKRLVKSPKIYVRDSGLVHSLLSIATPEGLLAHPVVGGSWEGFVVENLLSVVPRGTGAYFYRDSSGAELDLVLTMPSGEIWAVEVKRTTSPKVSRGFHTASNVVAADARFLVYAGDKEVPMPGDIRALPLPAMMDHLTQ